VSGRISDVRGQLLQLERSRADRRRELDQARYDLIKAEQTLAVRQSLHDKGFVSDVELRTVQAEADFRRTQTRTLQAAVDQEASMVTRQSGEIQRTLDQLQGNLASVRRSLDALNVRAPASGRLTAFELQPGQTVKPGDRIGQIDTEGAYKLAAQIDEFYLGRVALGQAASVRQDGRTYRAAVSRILPQVRNGRFQIELQFQGAHPAALRRGQTLDLEVTLGDTRPALILPNGPYLEATGGSWIFVVDKSGRRAERRMIKTGRRNPLEVEVLGGLQPGERVLTSSYQGFADQTRLILR
jgi:HlyD family secretion protein